MSSVYTTNFSYDYYLRSAYSQNRMARNSDTRIIFDNNSLVKADSSAMKKISKQLQDLEYDSDHGSEIYNTVKTYIETYNNLIDSASDSDSTSIESLKKQIGRLTKEEKKRLESIGINITGRGKLKLDEKVFVKSAPDKISKVFSSKSTLTKSLHTYASRIGKKASQLSTTYNSFGTKTTSSETASGASVNISL